MYIDKTSVARACLLLYYGLTGTDRELARRDGGGEQDEKITVTVNSHSFDFTVNDQN